MSSLPVFVFPSELVFSSSDQLNTNSMTRTLSLYNPYDFTIRFQLLSTCPQQFALSACDGQIRARHCLDIVVRLRDSHQSLQSARFLVKINEIDGQREGERQVMVTRTTAADNLRPVDREPFLQMTTSQEGHEPRQADRLWTDSSGGRGGGGVDSGSGQRVGLNKNALLAITCLLSCVLLVPHEESEDGTSFYWWLRVGVSHKLAVAYVLGLLTVLILRH